MYTNPAFSRATTDTFDHSHQSPQTLMEQEPSMFLYDQMLNCMEMNGHSISNTSGYVDTPPSSLNIINAESIMQRSASSHSLLRNNNGFLHYSHFASLHDFFDLENSTTPVRRAFSAGDLQHGRQSRGGSPLSSESSAIIESMSKACKYSPEEKKERIERYRTKRSQRNFSKKIKYECRKTLADSRPRIRGRFARNDELVDKNAQLMQWSNTNSGEEDHEEEDDDNWITLLDAFSSANSVPFY